MAIPQLGRLQPLDLRNIWTGEAAEFTPWLARPENFATLAESLGLGVKRKGNVIAHVIDNVRTAIAGC